MQEPSLFQTVDLENRLGQLVQLDVALVPAEARDYVFISAPAHQAAGFIGKNAEHFAFQLCQRLQLDPRRFELVEFRTGGESPCLWRWRFEWVGYSPLAGRSEAVTSASQQQLLFRLLALDSADLGSGVEAKAASVR